MANLEAYGFVFVTPTQKTWCQQKLGYEFQSQSLLSQAFMHPSTGHTSMGRLEFLGDAVLALVMTQALLARYPNLTEGDLTRKRALLVKKESLAAIARAIELADQLLLGPQFKKKSQVSDAMLADALEALLGAVMADGGWSSAQSVVMRLFETWADEWHHMSQDKDAKTRLQEFCHSQGWLLPHYKGEVIQIDAHTVHYRATLTHRQQRLTLTAATKKEAEQALAQQLLDQWQRP